MDSNQKKFNFYVFLSTFARSLIETFIPIILFESGSTLKEVILYYFFVNLFSLLLAHPCFLIAKKFGNKVLSFIGIFAFLILQILLNNLKQTFSFILILALIYALYRRGYWISRRFYNLRIMRKENISSTYSLISIVNQLAVIFASYAGALFLDFSNINILTLISIILFFISIIPLYLLKFEHKENSEKLEFFKTLKQVPKTDLYLFGTYELLNVIKFLFPLYLFIYIKDTYQTVGILNVITLASTMLFTYLYGKHINSDKNFLKTSIFLTVLIYFFKLNSTGIILAFVSFIEGIFTKMYEISIQKEFFELSKNFDYQNYNSVYEITQNLFRTIVVALLYLFINDLRIMITFVLLIILSGIFFNFRKSNINYYKKN
ncbi:MAG: MFS transporter [Clostridia bacterium]|nr:MFS transporter [Clostridia bacterium]